MGGDLPRGIRRTRDGLRAFVQVHGEVAEKHFPPTTPLEALQTWREQTHAQLVLGLRQREAAQPPPGSFRADALRYLESVTALPTYRERVRDIHLWIAVFGGRPRESITSADIRRQRDAWLRVGPRAVQYFELDPVTRRKVQRFRLVPGPLSASTVNHRLRALENLWTVLDGKRAPNPVRDVPEANEEDAPPRIVPLPLVRELLAAMPDSQAKARLSVLAWTGIPPATLKRLKKTDLDGAAVKLPGRRKGKGAKGRWLPLTAEGVRAFALLDSLDAWGPHSWDNVRRAFRAACRRVEKAHSKERLSLAHLRPYDLRHALAARAYLAVKDLKAVGDLLGHASTVTTQKYAAAAVDPVLRAAVAAVSRVEQRGRKSAATGRATGRSEPKSSKRKR